jgi:hypothetical protein
MISEQDVLLSKVGFIDDDRRVDGSSWHMTMSFIMINSHLLALSTVLSAMDHRLALYSVRFRPYTATQFPILYYGGFILCASKAFNTCTSLAFF